MDGECGVVCRLQCEISSVSIAGLGCGSGELFLRCHVPAGDGRAIQIGSLAVAEQPDGRAAGVVVSWRDVASLSCDGSPARVRELVDRRSVVFEVRRRPGTGRRAALRRILGSELVGRAEVAWRDAAAGVDDEAVERRVELAARRSGRQTLRGAEAEPPVLSVRMSVRVSETPAPAGRRRVDTSTHRESGCEWSVGEEDVFALAACAADGALE